MKYSCLKLMLVLGAACAFAGAQAQFVNGDFETGDLTGWTVTPTANGQTLVQDVQMFDTGLGPSKAAHFSVGQVNFMSGEEDGVYITQNFNLVAGTTYTFGCTWGAADTGTANNADGGTFDLVVGATSIANHAVSSLNAGTSVNGSLSGTFNPTTSGSYAVGAYVHRHYLAIGNMNQYVDNFTMSPVPEPASMAALGLGALAVIRRRKKA